MNPDEARQLIGIERTTSETEVEELFRQRFQEMESKIERAPTPSLKEKYRRNLAQLEEAWEALIPEEHRQVAENFPSLHPIIEQQATPAPAELRMQLEVQSPLPKRPNKVLPKSFWIPILVYAVATSIIFCIDLDVRILAVAAICLFITLACGFIAILVDRYTGRYKEVLQFVLATALVFSLPVAGHNSFTPFLLLSTAAAGGLCAIAAAGWLWVALYRKSLQLVWAPIVIFAWTAWYYEIVLPRELARDRLVELGEQQAQIVQQKAIQEEKKLEARQAADAAQKAQLETPTQPASTPPPTIPASSPIAPAASVPIPPSQPLATDSAEAAKYRASAATGDLEGARNLGYLYLIGGNTYGISQNINEATKWIQYAAAKGDLFSQGLEYQYGLNQIKDAAKAIGLYQSLALKGDVLAQNQLGLSYASGLGVQQDYAQANYWYQKAAESGNAEAEDKLGWLYRNGQGVFMQDQSLNDHLAFSWFQKAANQGNLDAEKQTAYSFASAKGVEHDDQQALFWEQKAAEQGDLSAEFLVGSMYLAGKDSPKALFWFQKAADSGNTSAQALVEKLRAEGVQAASDPLESAH